MTTPTTRRRLVCAAAALTILALAGCSQEGGGDAANGGGSAQLDEQSTAGSTTERGSAPLPAAPEGDGVTTTDGGLKAPALDDRSIIRTGTLRLRSDEVEQAALEAAAAARALGGLVSGEQTVTDPEDPDRTVAQLTLRVPSNRFDDLLVKVRDLGTVLGQTQQADDVTAQVVDVDARVEAQRASVRRIQALLARANTIGEVVTVEGQLSQRQADLEALEAQQKALKDQSAFATLEVSIVGPEPVAPDPAETESPSGFLAGFDRGWEAFTAAVTGGLTAIGVLLPFVGFALLILLPVAAWLRSRGRRTAPPATYEPPVREDQPVG